MSISQRLKIYIWKLVHAVSPPLHRQLTRRFSRSCHENWGYRTRLARACPDNAFIERVADAGKIVGDYQIMHNGLKVLRGSYYGEGPTMLFTKNKGVHEPQEERCFQEVLKAIRPGSVILELGAYWGFYSMWFCQQVPGARAYLVEPATENLSFGRRNFEANALKAHFTQAYVGGKTGRADDGTAIVCVDDFVAEHSLDHIAILHADIQGFELEMLEGSRGTFDAGRISWCFVSTHTEELHQACEKFLTDRGFVVEASVSIAASFSTDGVVVARAPGVPTAGPLNISMRTR